MPRPVMTSPQRNKEIASVYWRSVCSPLAMTRADKCLRRTCGCPVGEGEKYCNILCEDVDRPLLRSRAIAATAVACGKPQSKQISKRHLNRIRRPCEKDLTS